MPRKGSKASGLLRRIQEQALDLASLARELHKDLGESEARTISAKRAAARRGERKKRDEGE